MDDHSFRMLEYSQNILNNYDDKNYTNYNSSYHPKANGIAYFDKHVQPSHDDCVGSLLTNVNLLLFSLITMENGLVKNFGGLLG